MYLSYMIWLLHQFSWSVAQNNNSTSKVWDIHLQKLQTVQTHIQRVTRVLIVIPSLFSVPGNVEPEWGAMFVLTPDSNSELTDSHHTLIHLPFPFPCFNRNWCAYVVTRTVSCVMEDGVETYIKPDYQRCAWGQCPRVAWVSTPRLRVSGFYPEFSLALFKATGVLHPVHHLVLFPVCRLHSALSIFCLPGFNHEVRRASGWSCVLVSG